MMNKYSVVLISMLFNLIVLLIVFYFMPVPINVNLMNKAVEVNFNILQEDERGGRMKLYVKNNTNKFIDKINVDLKLYRCLNAECYVENVINKTLKLKVKPGGVRDQVYDLGSFPNPASNSYRFIEADVKKIHYNFSKVLAGNDQEYPFKIEINN